MDLPAGIGAEGVGIVETVGAGVTTCKVGDRVDLHRAPMTLSSSRCSRWPIFPRSFGGLDYSGMAILTALRSTFPNAQTWRPGYEPMVERLRNGEGHSPSETGEERQRPNDWAGCPYADEVLIPTLKASGFFIDQE
jgi:hypothetical protein